MKHNFQRTSYNGKETSFVSLRLAWGEFKRYNKHAFTVKLREKFIFQLILLEGFKYGATYYNSKISV